MAGRKKAHPLASHTTVNYEKVAYVTAEQLEKARKSGERIPLRVLIPGHDKKRFEYTRTILYGKATHIGIVPFEEKPKTHQEVQMCFTTSIDNIRLFDKSEPLKNY